MLLTIQVGAFVAGLTWPYLDAVTVLLVVEPLTLVDRSLIMSVLALTVGLIILPLSFILVAIGVYQSAHPASLALDPLAAVKRAIWPDLRSVTMAFRS